MNRLLQSSWSILLQSFKGATRYLIVASLLAPCGYAILDTNYNGVSDIWEREHNAGELFPESFNPQADYDHDSWNNMEEAAAGTDPNDANPPDGIIRPATEHVPAVIGEQNGAPHVVSSESIKVRWLTLTGKQYTLLYSPDLTQGSWLPVGDPVIANGGVSEYVFYEINATDKCFWRVSVSDVDADQDGLTNHEEHQIGTNPTNPDTDYDGMEDRWEIAHGLDPVDRYDAYGDPDGDGIQNEYEYVLGFHPMVAEPAGQTSDRDNDGMPDIWEARTGNFKWSSQNQRYEFQRGLDWEKPADAAQDADADELVNLVEYQNTTDPFDPDTDDDFMPDGWEVLNHGKTITRTTGSAAAPSSPAASSSETVSLDPLDASDAALDPDQDGLTNLQEYLNGTLPERDDTDGDGTSDGDEVNTGADPNNGSDGGTPGGQGGGTVVVEVPFAIGGDYAWWEMTIQAQGPTDTRNLKITSNKDAESGLGDYVGETQMIKLHAGNKYRMTMKRMGGVAEEDGAKWYCWSANVGKNPDTDELLPEVETFFNYPDSKNERLEGQATAYAVAGENADGKKATWLADNREGLLTKHIDDLDKDVAQGLEAFLVPVDIDDNVIATGVDDVSITADPQDIGYQDKSWIMAPSGNDPNGNACSNEMKFKIPFSSTTELKIFYPQGAQAPATPTPGTVTLGAADAVCAWHGESATTTETPATEWKIGAAGGIKTEVDLPIAVKTMKRRTVKVAVYRVQRANSRAFPSFPVSDKNEIKNQLHKVFAYQVNAWFEPDYFDVNLNYDTNNDGRLDVGSAEEGALATAAELNGTNSSHDVKVIIVDDLEYYWLNPRTVNVERVSGHWIEGSNTCIVIFGSRQMDPRTQEMIVNPVLADRLGHTMAHEIGHMMFNVGHPDKFDPSQPVESGGPAPLQSLNKQADWRKRLMCSGNLSLVSSNLLVKKEWDLAEEWLLGNID